MSVRTSTELATVAAKIQGYEKAITTSNNWFERAALAGDPSSSGVSTIITNQYIEQTMDVYDFDDIETEFSGGWGNFLRNEINNGVAYVNYRGYIGVSGFGNSDVNNLNNGYMLPFATIITCSTGSFSWDSYALSEKLFNAGSAANPKGAVAAIGTATSGTHTIFNNAVDLGIYWGIFPMGGRTAGEALAYGKLHLHNTYPSDPSNNTSIFTYWNNLMGDPATLLWTDTPDGLIVDFPTAAAVGTNFIDVSVMDSNGNPVQDAFVTLLKGNDEIFVSKMSNADGLARFEFNGLDAGEIDVTVTKRNYIPFEGEIDVDADLPSVNIYNDGVSIDDNMGNNDGLLNPGETVTVNIPIMNYGAMGVSYGELELVSNNPLLTVIDEGPFSFSGLGSGASETGAFDIQLAGNTVHNEELDLRLNITTDIGDFVSLVPLDVHGGYLMVEEYYYEGTGTLLPGLEKSVFVNLKNLGSMDLDQVTGTLSYDGDELEIEDTPLTWGDISAQNSSYSQNAVSITASETIIRGSHLPLQLHLTNDDGYDRVEALSIQVGDVTEMDPLGPDQHGYYIYDSGDLGYNLAAIYDWYEIDPSNGGNGSNLNLNNNGEGNPSFQQSETVNLPWDFGFYGIEYDEITVCTNGWIAFGQTEMTSFRNYPVPGAGGPSPMIAAFWDDLKTTNGGDVYTYYDLGMDAFIIQWSGMRNNSGNDNQDFQVILYNTLTPTGDGEIKIQYKTFNNTSSGSYGGWSFLHGGYATIGIENHDQTEGLQYTYYNSYPEAAMQLDDETAIFITTRPSNPLLLGDVDQDGLINIVDVVLIVQHILNLDHLDPIGTYIADMNGDGELNVFDIIILINIILG